MEAAEEKNLLVTELADQGKGRASIIIYEAGGIDNIARELYSEISKSSRAILLQVPEVNNTNWVETSRALMAYLASKNIRQAAFIGFADAASVILNLALHDLKMVRSMVLVDTATRPHPSLAQRITDKIERFLPLGLPLRSHDQGFDAKPFLQRMRCPALIVNSSRGTQYTRSQAEIFQTGLPTAWSAELNPANELEDLKRLIAEFQLTPAKCPQKNA